MRCIDLDPFIEAIADVGWEPDAAGRAHLATCAQCAARVALAREIDRFFANRETPPPPVNFTAMVMAGVAKERWRTERAVDISFNLAVAAGVLVILSSAAGAAWSLGLLTVRIDLDAIANALGSDLASRVLSQAQTVGVAAGLLTMALVLWWWAETESV
jgi:anti-sigma factor RsiW